jgi:hypothetical protein
MLEVVEHQEQLTVAQGTLQAREQLTTIALLMTKRTPERDQYLAGFANRREWDKGDAIGEGIAHTGGKLYSQTCLADARRADQRQQMHI